MRLPEVRRILAHAPLERPQSGRVLQKAGFAMAREMDDVDEAGDVMRVKEWVLRSSYAAHSVPCGVDSALSRAEHQSTIRWRDLATA